MIPNWSCQSVRTDEDIWRNSSWSVDPPLRLGGIGDWIGVVNLLGLSHAGVPRLDPCVSTQCVRGLGLNQVLVTAWNSVHSEAPGSSSIITLADAPSLAELGEIG